MFIESNSLWILFIDRYFLNSVFFDAILHQLSSGARKSISRQAFSVPIKAIGVPDSFSAMTRCSTPYEPGGILPTDVPSESALHTSVPRVRYRRFAGSPLRCI